MSSLKFIPRIKIAIILFITLLMCTVVSSVAELMQFKNYAEKLTVNLASSLIEGEELAIRHELGKINNEYGWHVIVQALDGRTVRSSVISSNFCAGNLHMNIVYMGIKLGSISGCVLLMPLIANSVTSKVFYLTFLLVQFLGLIYVFWAKAETENNLLNLIKNLEDSEVKQSEEFKYNGKKSKIFAKVEGLIQSREQALQNAIFVKLKLEEEKAVSQIARQVSHDIRSPLSALNLVTSTFDKHDLRVQVLIESTKRISEIANDLLEQNRKTSLVSTESYSLSELLNPIIKEFEYRYQTTFILNCNLAVLFFCNRVEFQRTISNIFQNSIEATLPDKKKSVIELSLEHIDNYLVLAIRDNGKGFDQLVFDNFGRASISVGKINGNGLGLSSAHNFMTEIEGKIQIRNCENGAVVSLHFPCASRALKRLVI